MSLKAFILIVSLTGLLVAAAPPSAIAAPPSPDTPKSSINARLPELKLEGATLSDAIEFLRDASGANIHVNWRALEAVGITKDAVINLRVRDVRLSQALTLVLNEAGGGNVALTYYEDQNVIEITTKELADKQLLTVVYPVEDMLVEIPDFTNAPNLDLNSVSSGGSGGGSGKGKGKSGGSNSGSGGLFGSGSTDGSDKTKTRAERGDDLVTLIRDTVYPEIWHENGGSASIRYYSGKIIVTAPRSVQEAIGGRFR